MAPTFRYGVVDDNETLTKIELSERLGVNMRTLDRRLEELDVVPYASGSSAPQISGYVYNLAVRQECMRLRSERQNQRAEEKEPGT